MQLQFTKIHGAGNDFIVVNDLAQKIELTPKQVARLCDRHFGIGADGVILIRPSQNSQAAAYMHYINSDGTLAEMCGNGVRCFAKFLVDNDLVDSSSGSLIADTMAGLKPINFEVDANGKLTSATVDMGEPAFAPNLIPTNLLETRQINIAYPGSPTEQLVPAVVQAVARGPQTNLPLSCVNMGNPHAVIFLEYLDDVTAQAFVQNPISFDVDSPGRYLESNQSCFPEKTNVEFAAKSGNNKIKMRVYERGVGETLACGTGACATAVAAVILGLVTRTETIEVELLGGTLEINWLPNNHVQMRGPAMTIFEGNIDI
ncbi:diaminopimelate epimerase [Actinomycetota bacterium]|nr:diaminopimelate epimerase [Actinomycetota bacterium]